MAPALVHLRTSSPPLLSSEPSAAFVRSRCAASIRRGGAAGGWRAMVQQQTFQQGPAATYAREMERLNAKESLLLAFKDAGGFQSLTSGKVTEMHKIDVNERIIALERLNPTPRPTTSPFLEGRWNFEWFGDGSPESLAARFLFERSTALVLLLGLDVLIKDGYSRITASLKLLNVIQSKFTLTTRLSVEGPIRMKEEYIEGLLEPPTFNEEALPEQLKGVLGQASGTLQQLPDPVRNTFADGLKLPLSGTFQRMFMISYLDEEILIVRDSAGAPDVLMRLEGLPAPATGELNPEYES